MELQVTKVVFHRFFDAVPAMYGHKGICSVFLNHHFAINNILITRPKREPGDDEQPELTIKLPCLRNYVESKREEGSYDMYRRNIVTVVDAELLEHIEEKVMETFNSGYMEAISYLKNGIPFPSEKRPKYSIPLSDIQPVPEFTNIKFYKFIPAKAEGPACRFDTYVFSCSMNGVDLCEIRLVLRPLGLYVAMPVQRRYESATGELINKERTNNLVTPITHQCRTAMERAASDAFDVFCQRGMVLDDGADLPYNVIIRAEQRRRFNNP